MRVVLKSLWADCYFELVESNGFMGTNRSTWVKW
jgi:hypothetical protein